MKRVVMIVIIITLIFFTGCSTDQSANPNYYSSTKSLNQPMLMTDNGYSFMISVDQLKFDQSNPRTHRLSVHMTVKNTGSKALGLTCYSKITDYGGVTTSGLGAGTNLLYPDESQSIKDYLIIPEKQFNALSRDSKLNVNCIGTESIGKGWMKFDASWDVKPEDFK